MMNRPLIERISTFVLRSAVFFIVVSFFLRALSEVSSRGLGLFVDLVSAALALIPAISAVVYLHFRRQLPFRRVSFLFASWPVIHRCGSTWDGCFC